MILRNSGNASREVKDMLFFLGGAGYVLLELLYRGRSHYSMFLAGGVCFLLLGKLEEVEPRLPGVIRPLVGAGIITTVELAAGLIFNRDYAGTIGASPGISAARSARNLPSSGFPWPGARESSTGACGVNHKILAIFCASGYNVVQRSSFL